MPRFMGYTKMSDAVAVYVREQLSEGTPIDSIAFDLRTALIAAVPDNETLAAAQAMIVRATREAK